MKSCFPEQIHFFFPLIVTVVRVCSQCVRSPAGGRHQGSAGEGTQQRRRGVRRGRRDGQGAEGEDLPATPDPETDR